MNKRITHDEAEHALIRLKNAGDFNVLADYISRQRQREANMREEVEDEWSDVLQLLRPYCSEGESYYDAMQRILRGISK